MKEISLAADVTLSYFTKGTYPSILAPLWAKHNPSVSHGKDPLALLKAATKNEALSLVLFFLPIFTFVAGLVIPIILLILDSGHFGSDLLFFGSLIGATVAAACIYRFLTRPFNRRHAQEIDICNAFGADILELQSFLGTHEKCSTGRSLSEQAMEIIKRRCGMLVTKLLETDWDAEHFCAVSTHLEMLRVHTKLVQRFGLIDNAEWTAFKLCAELYASVTRAPK